MENIEQTESGYCANEEKQYSLEEHPERMVLKETRTEKLTMKVRPSEEELYAILAEYKTPGKANISDLLYHICALGIQRWLETKQFIDQSDPPPDILARFHHWTRNDPHAIAAKKRLKDRIDRKKLAAQPDDEKEIEVIEP